MTNIVEENRVGSFFIYEHLIRNNPDAIKKILGEFLIVRSEMLFIRNAIEYIAYNEKFDIVKEGELPPSYDINIEVFGNGDFAWTLSKKE